MIRIAAYLTIITSVFSCTGTCTKSHSSMRPEQVVEAYLDVALNLTRISERANLLKYTTGNLHSAIAEVSDETIQKAYIDRKIKLKSYSLLERRDRTPRESEITFQIIYDDLQTTPDLKEDQAATIKTDNTVRVIREKGLWLVSDVLGKKTSIEFPDLKDMEIRVKAP
jgi:hypothetical protein